MRYSHKYFLILICVCLYKNIYAQTLQDTLHHPFIDFFFFNGEKDVVAFYIGEDLSCKEFTISGQDTAAFCFTITPGAYDSLQFAMNAIRQQVESQTTLSVKCRECITMQLFWNDGTRQRSIMKKSYNIPPAFGEVLDLCYDKSEEKKPCSASMRDFLSFDGFIDQFRKLGKE